MARNTDTALRIIQSGDLRRRFRRRVSGVYVSMTDTVVKCQIRDKVGGRLILDLAPYFTVAPETPTDLTLFVPGSVTADLTTDGVWDVFFDGQYITGGPVDLVRTVSQ